MLNQQTLDGDWNAIKVKLQEKWRQLADSDLPKICDDLDNLVGVIQRKTGENRRAIESYLNTMSGNAASATAAATDYGRRTADTIEQTAEKAFGRVRAGFTEVKRFVRDRPGESVLVCVGIGLIAGVLASAALRSR